MRQQIENSKAITNIDAITSTFNEDCKELIIKNNNLEGELGKKLSEFLYKFPNKEDLHILDISYNNLGSANIGIIFEAIPENVTELKIGHNYLYNKDNKDNNTNDIILAIQSLTCNLQKLTFDLDSIFKYREKNDQCAILVAIYEKFPDVILAIEPDDVELRKKIIDWPVKDLLQFYPKTNQYTENDLEISKEADNDDGVKVEFEVSAEEQKIDSETPKEGEVSIDENSDEESEIYLEEDIKIEPVIFNENQITLENDGQQENRSSYDVGINKDELNRNSGKILKEADNADEVGLKFKESAEEQKVDSETPKEDEVSIDENSDVESEILNENQNALENDQQESSSVYDASIEDKLNGNSNNIIKEADTKYEVELKFNEPAKQQQQQQQQQQQHGDVEKPKKDEVSIEKLKQYYLKNDGNKLTAFRLFNTKDMKKIRKALHERANKNPNGASSMVVQEFGLSDEDTTPSP